ncbi:transposase [Nonomuraea sp. NPDC050202]|uniref:transposase n=1 Tax=Nonomuraea sp. NPDC050202 TaxID=3155035 RepID=UPI0033DC70B7
MQPRPWPQVPELTAAVAQAAFPKGCLAMRVRDELGVLFADEEFASAFGRRGRPGISPGLLALVSVMQFAENLTDRQAAHAVRSRIDWKYLLGLELTDAGFDFTVLHGFRNRLLGHGQEMKILDLMLAKLAELGLLTAGGRQRSDSTHVLAAVRTLNRLEFVAETLRAGLEALAAAAPQWLLAHVEPRWIEEYGSRAEGYRLPREEDERAALARQIGADGYRLLEALHNAGAPRWLRQITAVDTLRIVWIQQFQRVSRADGEQEVSWRKGEDLPPGRDLISSPYDIQARYATKRGSGWTGYTVHLSETCDDAALGRPHLTATDINDHDQIVGEANREPTDAKYAYLLEPGSPRPVIKSLSLETQRYPSEEWTEVPDGQANTIDGNRVRISVTVRNPTPFRLSRKLRISEIHRGKPLPGGEIDIDLEPHEVNTQRMTWDTAGFAWGDGYASGYRSLLAELFTVGGKQESSDSESIRVQPKPVVLVHGFRSNAKQAWEGYDAILRRINPHLHGFAVGDGQVPGRMNTDGDQNEGRRTFTLPQNVEQEGLYIEGVRKRTGAFHVDVLAHSMGGVITRRYIQAGMPSSPDGKPVINRLLQLGTPNRGTPCADILVNWYGGMNSEMPLTPAIEELTTDSMNTFNTEYTDLKGVKISSLVGVGNKSICTHYPRDFDGDGVVPADSARHVYTDVPTTLTTHVKMTKSVADAQAYVAPRLASLLAGEGEPAPLKSAGSVKATKGDASAVFATLSATAETGKTVSVPLEVPDGSHFGVVGMLPQTVGMVLRDPSGKPAASYTAGSEVAVEPFQGLSVAQPQAGAWKVEISNTGAEPVTVDLGAWVAGSPLKVAVAAEQVSDDGRVKVTATVTDHDKPVTGATVKAVLSALGGARHELVLKDDGGAGVYSATSEALADGRYHVVVRAETAQGLRTGQGVVEVAEGDQQRFELTLSAQPGGSVAASPEQDKYRPGTKVKVTATPDAGRMPMGWIVDGQERHSGGTLELVMDGPHTVVARFGSYAVTELGTLPGGYAGLTKAVAINDRGQVAATAGLTDTKTRAVRWQDGKLTDLGVLPCTDAPVMVCAATATGINEAGDVSGWAMTTTAQGNEQHAAVYRDGQVSDLHPESGEELHDSMALGLNDSGQVFGFRDKRSGSGAYVMWKGGTATPLAGDLELWTNDQPSGRINARGEVAAAYVTSRTPGAISRSPAFYDGTSTKALELPVRVGPLTCTGVAGAAHGVNASGLVVGGGLCNASNETVVHHAYTWKNGERTDLGAGIATAVNDHGLVAGFAGAPESAVPALWLAGVTYNLAELLPRPLCPEHTWETTQPCIGLKTLYDINSSGQIVAQGFVRDRSANVYGFIEESRSFVLTPTAAAPADLEVKHTASAAEPAPGSALTWTATVTNKGPGTAGDVRLDLLIPHNAGTPTCAAKQGTCSPLKEGFRITVPELPPGSSATVEVGTVLPAGLSDGTVLETRARAASFTVADLKPGDNSAEAIATVRPMLDKTGISWPDRVRIGSSSHPVAVTLTNRGNAPMPITAIAADAPFSQTNDCPAELAVGAKCVVQVVFTPTAEGKATGKLAFTTARGSAPAYAVTLDAWGAVANAGPVIQVPDPPLRGKEGEPFTLRVEFTDADASDTHTAKVVWDGGSMTDAQVTQRTGGGTVTATTTFTAPREDEAVVIVTDSKGDTVMQRIAYIIE